MYTKAALQEFAVLEVFRRAGRALSRDEILDGVESYASSELKETNLTVYPRGLSHVVEGFQRAGLLTRHSPGYLMITEAGEDIKRDVYDKIVGKTTSAKELVL